MCVCVCVCACVCVCVSCVNTEYVLILEGQDGAWSEYWSVMDEAELE